MLDQAFFARDVLEVAEDLLGSYLVRRIGERDIVVQLTEVEAYRGSDDPASHAFRGPTPRNRLMFGEAGVLYVYLIYGMHYCMNVVTNAPGEAGAVLLRGARPVEGIDLIRELRPNTPDKTLINGPGKLCKGLGVTLALNGLRLVSNPPGELYLMEKEQPLPFVRTERIGISQGKEFLWRFVADASIR